MNERNNRTYRCVTCNKVSNKEIETHPGEHDKKPFSSDPVDKLGYICAECMEAHLDLMEDYFYLDDPYGWEEDGVQDLINLDIEKESPVNDNATRIKPRPI